MPKYNTELDKQRTALIVAKEMAHNVFSKLFVRIFLRFLRIYTIFSILSGLETILHANFGKFTLIKKIFLFLYL